MNTTKYLMKYKKLNNFVPVSSAINILFVPVSITTTYLSLLLLFFIIYRYNLFIIIVIIFNNIFKLFIFESTQFQ